MARTQLSTAIEIIRSISRKRDSAAVGRAVQGLITQLNQDERRKAGIELLQMIKEEKERSRPSIDRLISQVAINHESGIPSPTIEEFLRSEVIDRPKWEREHLMQLEAVAQELASN